MSTEERGGGGGLFASFGTSLRNVMLARPPEAVAARRPFSVRWGIPQRYEDGSSSAPINCLIVVPIRPLIIITGGTLALAGRL
jgi:hypothetical protein